jgi:hypothetical protein
MMRGLSIEEIARVMQIVANCKTDLRGWTEDGPPAIEEKKP